MNSVKVIVILAPPMNVVYPFIVDVEGYPTQIINFFIVIVRRLPSLCIHSHLFHRACFGCVGKGQISLDRSRVGASCAKRDRR